MSGSLTPITQASLAAATARTALRPASQSEQVKKTTAIAKKANTCFECDKPASQLCGRCRKIFFCSKKCQRKSWKTHKLACIYIIGFKDVIKNMESPKIDPIVTHLDLSNRERVSEEMLEHVAKYYPNLQALDLSNSIVEGQLAPLTRIKHLWNLRLAFDFQGTRNPLEGKNWIFLPLIRNLTRLNLDGSKLFNDQSFNQENLIALLTCTKIQDLSLRRCWWMHMWATQLFSEKDKEDRVELPNLRAIAIDFRFNEDVEPTGYEFFPHHDKLQYLLGEVIDYYEMEDIRGVEKFNEVRKPAQFLHGESRTLDFFDSIIPGRNIGEHSIKEKPRPVRPF